MVGDKDVELWVLIPLTRGLLTKHNKDGEVAEVQALSDGVKGAIKP
jgi:hypothetical protein